MIKRAMKNLVPAVTAGAGAVGQGFVANLVPMDNALVKNGATFVLGLVLSGMKGKVMPSLGLGVCAASIQKIAQNYGIGAVSDPIMSIDDIDLLGVDSPILGNDEESLPENDLD